jgi:hypothetical protein
MDVEVFIEELRGRYQAIGKLNVVTTTNIPGLSEPRIDEVWFIENTSSGIEVHILELQAQYPTVVIDVPSHLSLRFPLGSSTNDVMEKANQGYSELEQELNSIETYSNIILDAYNATKAYAKATMLFSQYHSTNKDERLLEAYRALKGLELYSVKNIQLFDAIKGIAASREINLDS